jgi:hypothetical protein
LFRASISALRPLDQKSGESAVASPAASPQFLPNHRAPKTIAVSDIESIATADGNRAASSVSPRTVELTATAQGIPGGLRR